MKNKRILLLFFVILIIIFCIDVLYCNNRKIVILSGKIVKVECDIKEGNDNEYVSTKGTGIITFFEPSSEKFAAVGHSIKKDIEEIQGNIYYSHLSNIVKSKDGEVGNLYSKENSKLVIGKVEKNNDFGVYGSCKKSEFFGKEIEILEKNKIQKGSATLYIDFGDSSKKEYEIEIIEIYSNIEDSNSCFAVKIVDEELISKTGGIVKGMSGSPILQNGKLAGALTKVTSDDVSVGYGIFAEIMLSECENI